MDGTEKVDIMYKKLCILAGDNVQKISDGVICIRDTKNKLITVVVRSDVKELLLSSKQDTINQWFNIEYSIKVIGGKGVTNMTYCFYELSADEIDLSEFDTTNLRYMRNTFKEVLAHEVNLGNNKLYENLENIAFMFEKSKVDTICCNIKAPKLEDMQGAFSFCTCSNLEIEELTTDNVTDMADLFSGSTIREVDIRNWNTSKVTRLSSAFMNFTGEIHGIETIDTSELVNTNKMFLGLIAFGDIRNLNLSKWNISKLKETDSMFSKAEFDVLIIDWENQKSEWESATFMFNELDVMKLRLRLPRLSSRINIDYLFSEIEASRLEFIIKGQDMYILESNNICENSSIGEIRTDTELLMGSKLWEW